MTDSAIKGNIIVSTGRLVSPLDMRPEDIDIRDIAAGLAGIYRYGGHSGCVVDGKRKRLTVAEHCVKVSKVVETHVHRQSNPGLHLVDVDRFARDCAKQGLLHDAAEAYLGDQVRPLKMLLEYEFINARHDALSWTICSLFGTARHTYEPIPSIDRQIIGNEARVLFPVRPPEWVLPDEIPGVVIECWEPDDAEARFLARFRELWPEWVL